MKTHFTYEQITGIIQYQETGKKMVNICAFRTAMEKLEAKIDA